MTSNPVPYHWSSPDAASLAFLIATPDQLHSYTAVTVGPGQAGYFFLNDETHLCDQPGLYLLTGSMIHSLEEAEVIQRHGGETVNAYNARLMLIELQPRLSPAQAIEATAANGETATVNLAFRYRVTDVERFCRSGVTFRPGQALTQADPVISGALQRAAQSAALVLEKRAHEASHARAAEEAFLSDDALKAELRACASDALIPLGLTAESVCLSIARRQCPYCSKALSMAELQAHRCSGEGCGRALHTCPDCDTIVGAERENCPTCRRELLWCDPCQRYARVEKGRFCPVCHRACYPLPPREFLTLM